MGASWRSVDAIVDMVPDDVIAICRRLRELGKRGWVVGGCVRDVLRGEDAKDWDIATDARPDEVQRAFKKVIPTGIEHGTVTVVMRGVPYEVTTLRGEGAYVDGRRPQHVTFLEDIIEDLARRDFTFNAIAIDPLEGVLIDPFGGQGDLRSKVLRAVGEPLQRFTEDGLRVLRAARFAATLECRIDDATFAAMRDRAAHDTLRKVSVERVHDEWLKTMRARTPSLGFDVMRKCEVIDIHCPELRATIGCAQGGSHHHDVWEHTMRVLDACPPDPVLRVAALLHDVGKPPTRSGAGDEVRFDGHDEVGARMADDILRRLKFSNEHRVRIVALIRHHLPDYQPSWRDADVRRWLRRVTPAWMDDVCDLALADARGTAVEARAAAVEELRRRARRELDAGAVLEPRDLAIGGRELMSALGMPPGPRVGDTLAQLLERVIDEPALNTREALLDEARKLVEDRAP